MTDLRIRPTDSGAASPPDAVPAADRPSGFRPSARRRNRIAAGVAIAAVAVAGNVLVYSGLDADEAVVQVVRDVPAGERITPDMVRPVDVDVDDSVAVVPAARMDSVVGRYAKVRLVAGALVTEPALQTQPLVTAGTSVVAIQVAEGSLPVGLRERAPLEIVIPSDPNDAAGLPLTVEARVVALPITPGSAIGTQSLSVEVAAGEAATVAAAERVRVVLVEPWSDPARTDGQG